MADILACRQSNFHLHDDLLDGGELWEECRHVVPTATLQYEVVDERAVKGAEGGSHEHPDILKVSPIRSGKDHSGVPEVVPVLSEKDALAQIARVMKCTAEEA